MRRDRATVFDPSVRRACDAPKSSQVCAECQRTDVRRLLYRMNGKRYCAACLQAWCLSLPAVQADLVAWAMREQEG